MFYQRDEAGAETGGVHCRARIKAAGCFLLALGCIAVVSSMYGVFVGYNVGRSSSADGVAVGPRDRGEAARGRAEQRDLESIHQWRVVAARMFDRPGGLLYV
jgi:hypothetical protein